MYGDDYGSTALPYARKTPSANARYQGYADEYGGVSAGGVPTGAYGVERNSPAQRVPRLDTWDAVRPDAAQYGRGADLAGAVDSMSLYSGRSRVAPPRASPALGSSPLRFSPHLPRSPLEEPAPLPPVLPPVRFPLADATLTVPEPMLTAKMEAVMDQFASHTLEDHECVGSRMSAFVGALVRPMYDVDLTRAMHRTGYAAYFAPHHPGNHASGLQPGDRTPPRQSRRRPLTSSALQRRAELRGVITVLDMLLARTTDQCCYHVCVDSIYVAKAWGTWIPQWEQRGWPGEDTDARNSDAAGQPSGRISGRSSARLQRQRSGEATEDDSVSMTTTSSRRGTRRLVDEDLLRQLASLRQSFAESELQGGSRVHLYLIERAHNPADAMVREAGEYDATALSQSDVVAIKTSTERPERSSRAPSAASRQESAPVMNDTSMDSSELTFTSSRDSPRPSPLRMRSPSEPSLRNRALNSPRTAQAPGAQPSPRGARGPLSPRGTYARQGGSIQGSPAKAPPGPAAVNPAVGSPGTVPALPPASPTDQSPAARVGSPQSPHLRHWSSAHTLRSSPSVPSSADVSGPGAAALRGSPLPAGNGTQASLAPAPKPARAPPAPAPKPVSKPKPATPQMPPHSPVPAPAPIPVPLPKEEATRAAPSQPTQQPAAKATPRASTPTLAPPASQAADPAPAAASSAAPLAQPQPAPPAPPPAQPEQPAQPLTLESLQKLDKDAQAEDDPRFPGRKESRKRGAKSDSGSSILRRISPWFSRRKREGKKDKGGKPAGVQDDTATAVAVPSVPPRAESPAPVTPAPKAPTLPSTAADTGATAGTGAAAGAGVATAPATAPATGNGAEPAATATTAVQPPAEPFSPELGSPRPAAENLATLNALGLVLSEPAAQQAKPAAAAPDSAPAEAVATAPAAAAPAAAPTAAAPAATLAPAPAAAAAASAAPLPAPPITEADFAGAAPAQRRPVVDTSAAGDTRRMVRWNSGDTPQEGVTLPEEDEIESDESESPKIPRRRAMAEAARRERAAPPRRTVHPRQHSIDEEYLPVDLDDDADHTSLRMHAAVRSVTAGSRKPRSSAGEPRGQPRLARRSSSRERLGEDELLVSPRRRRQRLLPEDDVSSAHSSPRSPRRNAAGKAPSPRRRETGAGSYSSRGARYQRTAPAALSESDIE